MSLRAAQVRIYVDADILGLGKILAGLGHDVTYPSDSGAVIQKRQRAPCPITSPDVLDTDWIPQVAARGWLVITRDSMIIQNRNEIAAVRENKAKVVALNQRDAQTKWGQLEVFMTQWRRIEALVSEPGPFVWRVSRTAMTSIALDRLRPESPAMDSAFSVVTFDPPTPGGVVYFEYPSGALYLEVPDDVARYRLMFDHLRAMALSPEDSRRLLARSADDLA